MTAQDESHASRLRNRIIWGTFLVATFMMFGSLYYMVGATTAQVQALQNNQTISSMQHNTATLVTNYGNIEIELLTEQAPQTVKNFVDLADDGFYDNTKFHRVIQDFMIQGGDPLTTDDTQKDQWGTGGPGYMIDSEINDQKLVQGVVAMANRGPNTGGSQFFIVTAEATPWLDGKHTAFGKVTDGMDVVMEINSVETEARDVPIEPVVVEEVNLQ